MTTLAKASKTTPVAKKNESKKPVKKSATVAFTAEQRHRMISEASYYIAERNGFDSVRNTEFWLEAEKQIDNQILEA